MYSSAVVVSLHKEREGVMVQCYRDVDYIVIIPHHHSCIINIIPCIIIIISCIIIIIHHHPPSSSLPSSHTSCIAM